MYVPVSRLSVGDSIQGAVTRSHVGCNCDTTRMSSLYEQSLVTDIVHVLIIVTLLRKRRGGTLHCIRRQLIFTAGF